MYCKLICITAQCAEVEVVNSHMYGMHLHTWWGARGGFLGLLDTLTAQQMNAKSLMHCPLS